MVSMEIFLSQFSLEYLVTTWYSELTEEHRGISRQENRVLYLFTVFIKYV